MTKPSLIEKLNSLQNLGPDQIAQRLRPQAFFECSKLTRDQYDYLKQHATAFYNVTGPYWERMDTRPRFEQRLATYESWTTYEGFTGGYWSGWWIIAQPDYYEGIKCPTSSSG